jgi:hypothetical protein
MLILHGAPDVPVANVGTQAERIGSSLTQAHVFAQLCTSFAVLALIVITTIGVTKQVTTLINILTTSKVKPEAKIVASIE